MCMSQSASYLNELFFFFFAVLNEAVSNLQRKGANCQYLEIKSKLKKKKSMTSNYDNLGLSCLLSENQSYHN